jgi:hypothetical protein
VFLTLMLNPTALREPRTRLASDDLVGLDKHDVLIESLDRVSLKLEGQCVGLMIDCLYLNSFKHFMNLFQSN